jgi:formate/nitrite transporter FocA (FNT family)
MPEPPRQFIIPGGIDALLPPDIAIACEAAGVLKASRDALDLLVLGLLAGAFLAFGAVLGNVVGGSLMVGAIYWLLYLRKRPKPAADR